MNNFPQQPVPAQSNKKLWIILGSVIGVLVIVMGGCVACGALIGLSRLSNENVASSDSDRDDDGSGRGSNKRKTAAGTLSGTSWAGTLNCDHGDDIQVVFKFAESGNPIYDYRNKSGLQEVEITSPGQSLRFVPPEGGVTSITFDELEVSADRVSHTMSVSKERTSGGTLVQSQARIVTEAVLSGSELSVENNIRSQSTTSQPGIMLPGDEEVIVCRGNLKQE
jgi:hypothetical protein